jgi:hypothetical protein
LTEVLAEQHTAELLADVIGVGAHPDFGWKSGGVPPSGDLSGSPEPPREEDAHDDDQDQKPQDPDDAAHGEGGGDGDREDEHDHGAADNLEDPVRGRTLAGEDSPPSRDERMVGACPICGASLEGKRRDARFCGSSCRREHGRLRRLLSGQSDSGYRNSRSTTEGPGSVQVTSEDHRGRALKTLRALSFGLRVGRATK